MHLERNGMGDLVNGAYPIPQNPIYPQYNPGYGNSSLSNPIMEAVTAAQVAGQATGMGDLVTGNYPIPWNPIVNGGSSLTAPRAMMCDTQNALATSVASMTAGPTAQLSGFDLKTRANLLGMRGMGQDLGTDLSNITGSVSDLMSGTTFGLSNWIVYGGGALAAWMLFANKRAPGTSRYHRARKAASAF